MKQVILLTGALAVLFIVWLIVSSYKHSGQAKIDIKVIPEDSSVTMDGLPIKQGGSYIKPGTHKFIARKSGFDDAVLSASVQKKETRDIILLPNPASTEAKQWLAAHPDTQRQREALESANVALVQKYLKDHYPILAHLPLDTIHYTIDYGKSQKYPYDPTKIALYVTAVPQFRDMALQWIKFRGYDPSNFEIVYQNP